MQAPLLQDDAFLADLAEVRSRRDGRLHAWWLGQSGFLVTWRDKTVLFDPYLSDSLTRKYAATDKPHVRLTGRVVDPARLSGIDVITTSHNHTDHLDPETLRPLLAANPEAALVGPAANRATIAERTGRPAETLTLLDDGRSADVAGLRFHAIAAAHNDLRTDAEGRHHFLGFIAAIGPWTVYHSGDTRLYPGLEDRLGRFSIDLAFLPINGFQPERRVAGNLDAGEAVRLARETGLRHIIPHHFDMFAFNTVDPAPFAEAARAAGQPATVLRNGERWSSPEARR
ncbi:MAG: MBL fold metallo-hydrolase [Puniceicoccaceae bacterium]|nr:MAG: MBL fold metallo-hydrolase [Puniceicoccaceae bacterium]